MYKNKFAIIVSRFNEEITEGLLHGAQERFAELNISEDALTIIKVPGAVEIPLIAKLLAKQNKYQAIICLGAVIRGETSHYDYVCEQISQGCQRVMLDHEVPVIFGVLTTENEEQAKDRIGGKHGHKGKEAVDAAIEMAAHVEKIIGAF
jgi:6,7-dimethyl-8-ribityllumazine synthase